MSAVAFAEGGAKVVTLENDLAIAETAKTIFEKANVDESIKLIVGNAKKVNLQFSSKRFEKQFQMVLNCPKLSYMGSNYPNRS